MAEELGGKIVLEKFELDSDEMIVAKKIIGKYVEKISKLTEYERVKVEMKVHKKTKNNHFEIKGHVEFTGGKAVSEVQDTNPFIAIDSVMSKMLKEIEHKIRKK